MNKNKQSKNDGSNAPTLCERTIWKFYEWAVIVAPILLMLSHWYIFYVFSQNSHELMHYSDANEICIAWIYTTIYLYVPLLILPASYFFKWCNLFRIPFVYFIFINVERWYYGCWFCTNEMIDTHYILIYCIIMLYAFELTEIFLRDLSYILRFGKKWTRIICLSIRKRVRKMNEEDEKRINAIIKSLIEESK